MDVDSVGRHLRTVAHCGSMNVYIQVISGHYTTLSRCLVIIFVFSVFVSGEKPYACPVCPRAFNQRVVLREHIRSHHSIVDPTYANSSSPHYCVVCGDRFKTPKEIIQHLIEHSDSNTASKRQPTVRSTKNEINSLNVVHKFSVPNFCNQLQTGPRKYKRRRKLKPDELERWRSNMPNIESSSADLDTSHTSQKSQERQQDVLVDDLYGQEMVPYNKPAKPVKRARAAKDAHLLDEMLQDLDDTLQDIAPVAISPSATVKTTAKSPTKKRATKTNNPVSNEMAANANVSRPKMIHTQKTRVPVEDGKRKSRTLVTRSAPEPVASSPPPSASKIKARRMVAGTQPPKLDYIEQNASPAKQTRNSAKSNRDIDSSLAESNLLLELSKKNLNYSPDVVNDLEEILRSPIKSKDSLDDPLQDAHDATDTIIDELPSKNTRVSKRISTRQSQRKPATHKEIVARQTPTRSSARIAKPSTPASSSQRAHTQTQSSSSMAVDDELINAIVMNIKHEKEESYTMTSDEFFTCEMCSAVFRDRAQLLVHVPIHI